MSTFRMFYKIKINLEITSKNHFKIMINNKVYTIREKLKVILIYCTEDRNKATVLVLMEPGASTAKCIIRTHWTGHSAQAGSDPRHNNIGTILLSSD